MSCICPSGYSANTSGNFCERILITGATFNGSFFPVSACTQPLNAWGTGGAVFYEDVSNLSLPISVSANTGQFTTNNGTILFNTYFFKDSSGRILDIQAGGYGSGFTCTQPGTFNATTTCITNNTYGPPFLRNNVWGGYGTLGRLYQAGVWTTIANPAPPINEWIGFSQCINVSSAQTFYVGLAADNAFRFKVNGQLIVSETNAISPILPTPSAQYRDWDRGLSYGTWSVFPYTFQPGSNVIEMEGLNTGAFAGFAVEIYSGSLSAITAVTTTVQLDALTVFSSSDKVGGVFDTGDSRGYSCPDGYSLVTCSGSPYCIQILQTPCINPTPTPTPTLTPTPTPTPQPRSVYVSVNECEPITVETMKVSCEILNITNATGSTKSMKVSVTGGTSPYTFTWSNGVTSSGLSPQAINNLSAGTYSVVVEDYWGDFTEISSCTVPPAAINCNSVKISTNYEVTCDVSGGVGTGTGSIFFTTNGGTAPYTYSGTVNGSPTILTNPYVVNNLDVINVVVTDYNGCKSNSLSILVSCPSGSEPLNCTTTNCPNGNDYTFGMSATCIDTIVLFQSNLTSNNPSTKVKGSYKISNVNIPNPFLDVFNPSATLDRTNYYVDANGSPIVELSDFLEIGFNQLTPTTLTNNDSPWVLSIVPHSYPGYVPPSPFSSGTILTIDVALYDEDYCVHKGSGSIVLPTCNGSTMTTTTINF